MDYLEQFLENYENAKKGLVSQVKDYFEESKSISRAELVKFGAICVLAGVVYGFLLSPIKKGICVNVTNNKEASGEADSKCCKDKKEKKEKKKRKCCCSKEA